MLLYCCVSQIAGQQNHEFRIAVRLALVGRILLGSLLFARQCGRVYLTKHLRTGSYIGFMYLVKRRLLLLNPNNTAFMALFTMTQSVLGQF